MTDDNALAASIREREERRPHAPAKVFGVDERDIEQLERTCAELQVAGRSKDELFFSDDQDTEGHLEKVFRVDC